MIDGINLGIKAAEFLRLEKSVKDSSVLKVHAQSTDRLEQVNEQI